MPCLPRIGLPFLHVESSTVEPRRVPVIPMSTRSHRRLNSAVQSGATTSFSAWSIFTPKRIPVFLWVPFVGARVMVRGELHPARIE